jgi:ABC-type bacteriocin/lantibiotic exporter with double-glycine peptidase domain
MRAVLQLGRLSGRGGVVLQKGEYDCGIAVFLMLQGRKPLPSRLVVTPGKGISMASLRDALNTRDHRKWKFGFDPPHQTYPFIALLRWGHYVIVDRIRDNTVYTRDPALGRVQYARSMFNIVWSGYGLFPVR